MDDSKEHRSTGSYLEPRIPSITGFGQRKVNGKPKKLLDYSMEKYNDHSGIPKIDVCLRIKPRISSFSTGFDSLTILNDNTVACNNGNGRDDITEYTFSSVFDPNVDQKQFFNIWVMEKVLNFLNGNNELLLAYGTTNAGKTYTIHGTSNDPGLIPRTLNFVFKSLNNKLMSQSKYKPDKVHAAHILDEKLMECEENIRKNILNNWANEKIQDDFKCISQVDEGQMMCNIDSLTYNNITKIFDSLKDEDMISLDHGNVSYSVWVTYSEIYNETIHDLLVTPIANQKRKALKLSHDQNKNVYVRDLTHVFVQSAEEAYKVMSFGRNNLKIASNNLNKSSSRSHCIFTLKLMRVENIEDPKTAVISSISFCDLAGSERLKKTMNIGDRLKESKNINTSLLVLNKCFSVLRENQKRGENHLVPYRESKLTQMFQTVLTGSSSTGISMAVNVDLSPSLFEETKQVLFMSAIVRSIKKAKSKPISKPRPSFAIWAANNSKNITQVKPKENAIVENEEISDDSISQKMITKEEFEVRLNEEKAKLRKELLAQFHTILDKNNTFHKNQKDTMVKNKIEYYESKIKRLKENYLEELQEKNRKIASLDSNIQIANNFERIQNKSEVESYEFRIGELELQKEELLHEINGLKSLQELHLEELHSKNEEIKNYEIMLKEANTEYSQMEILLNDANNKFDEMKDKFDELYQETEEKNLEIERLTGLLDAKENDILEMEIHQDTLIAEAAEQKILEYMDEKLETIVGLENTVKKLKAKNKKYIEENADIAKRYQIIKQQLINTTKTAEQFNNDSVLSKLSSKDLKIKELKEHIKVLEDKFKESKDESQTLQNTINKLQSDLKTTNIKPEMKNISVLTDLSNVQLPLGFIVESESQENKSGKKPQRRCKSKTPASHIKKPKILNKDTSEMFENYEIDEAINNIPISIHKRKLFDNKPPLADSSNMVCDNNMDSMITPSHALHRLAKLRAKK